MASSAYASSCARESAARVRASSPATHHRDHDRESKYGRTHATLGGRVEAFRSKSRHHCGSPQRCADESARIPNRNACRSCCYGHALGVGSLNLFHAQYTRQRKSPLSQASAGTSGAVRTAQVFQASELDLRASQRHRFLVPNHVTSAAPALCHIWPVHPSVFRTEGVTAFAMRLESMCSQHVFMERDRLKMGGIHATLIQAGMVKNQPVRNWPLEQFVDSAVRENRPTRYRCMSVAVTVNLAGPRPAPIAFHQNVASEVHRTSSQ